MNNELEFKGGNPGAVQFGNFINYYQFNPPSERIKLLPKNIWNKSAKYVALDIGCNAGDLTGALWDFLLLENNIKDISMLGIDIDPLLIERANENFSGKISFKCLNIMDETHRNLIITEFLNSLNVNKFSAVFCFSTTMWIHINYGDLGLISFLKYISSISDLVIIEPQPWKCYKTAVKRMKQKNFTFPQFGQLKYRENVEDFIENILTSQCDMIKIHESERTKWDRKLLIFKNK